MNNIVHFAIPQTHQDNRKEGKRKITVVKLPSQVSFIEIDHREAIGCLAFRWCNSLLGTGIVALRLPLAKKVALSFTHPVFRFRIDVHLGILENLNETRIATQDFKYLLNILYSWKRKAGIAFTFEKLLTVILAERLAANHHNIF